MQCFFTVMQIAILVILGNEIHSETDIIRIEEIYEDGNKNGNKKKEVIFEEKIVKENTLKSEGKRSHMLHGSGDENTDWRCGIAHDYVLMADDLYLGLFSSKDLGNLLFFFKIWVYVDVAICRLVFKLNE